MSINMYLYVFSNPFFIIPWFWSLVHHILNQDNSMKIFVFMLIYLCQFDTWKNISKWWKIQSCRVKSFKTNRDTLSRPDHSLVIKDFVYLWRYLLFFSSLCLSKLTLIYRSQSVVCVMTFSWHSHDTTQISWHTYQASHWFYLDFV